MKKIILLLLLVSSCTFAQNKYEVNLAIGYHVKMDGSYTYFTDIQANGTPFLIEKDGFASSGKETNFYLNVNVLKEFGNSIYAGLQGQLNISNGFVNYSPMLAGKYYFSNEKVKPYAKAGIGLNFMSYNKNFADKVGYIWEVGGGTNIQLSSLIYLDIGLSYNQMKNTFNAEYNTWQSINNIVFSAGLSYGF